MNIDVQARHFPLTDGIRRAVAGAAAHYAGKFGRLVRKVAVRVYDLNGPRGGRDKGCLVVADLADGRTIVSSDVDQDLYRAIPRAFAKVQRSTQSIRRHERTRRHAPASRSRGLVEMDGRDVLSAP